jgi:hypothetical protein
MRRAIRENALCAFLAGAGCATLAWLGLYGFAWSDYEDEARPSFEALTHGHVLEFLRLAPTYGGSLVERAPFALIPDLWGGGQLAVYRMVALPCLLASAVLAVLLLAHMRTDGHSRIARATVLGLCAANPVTLRALEIGHPEDLLGGCLCIMAVLLAAGAPAEARARALGAGVLLGLAIANKEWALLAAGPVLLALPARRRLLCLAGAIVSSAGVLAPLALASAGGFVASARSATVPASPIFQPWQLWWFLGHHGALVHGAFGVPKPGYRIGPAWTTDVSHPLIVLVGLAIAAAVWLRTRGQRLGVREALLMLTLVLLLRCVLDTWDSVYYPIPFLLALLAWEARGPASRPPLLALCATVLAWLSFQWLPDHVSPDAQAAFFLAWTLPSIAWLSLRVLAPGHRSQPQPIAALRGVSPAPGGAQAMTVSALGRPVSTS